MGCVPVLRSGVAERVDRQDLGVYMGVWILILGATEASVSQGLVCASLNERLKKHGEGSAGFDRMDLDLQEIA